MKRSKFSAFLLSLFFMASCATYKEGLPTSHIIQCPDGNRPFIDCRMAFEQYKQVLKVDVNIISSLGAGVGFGAQQLINLDSITGDLLAHKHQVCIEYNNCMITKEEYIQEQRYLRRAQIKIRELTTTTASTVGSINTNQSLQSGQQSMVPTVSIDEKVNTAKDDGEIKLDLNFNNPAVLDELNNLEQRIQTIAKSRSAGVSSSSEKEQISDTSVKSKKVQIEYSISVRRERPSSKRSGDKYEFINFYPGVTLKTGDQLKISFTTDSDGHVYVVNYDSSGKAQIIFPHPAAGSDNNAKGKKTYEIPSSPSSWYFLDDVKGKETLYLVASPFPILNLDSLVSDLKQDKSGTQSNIKNARLRGSLEALTRGIGVATDEKEGAELKRTDSAINTVRIEFNHQ